MRAIFPVSGDSRVRNQHKNFCRFGSIEVERVERSKSLGGVDSVLIRTNYIAGSPASMMSLTTDDARTLLDALIAALGGASEAKS